MNGAERTAAPTSINARDIITLTARLAELLAEEVDLLGDMKMKKIQELQQEKQIIISALEAHRRLIDRHPHLTETIPSQDKRDLEGLVEVFQDILSENHRRLLRAREVNRKIVQVVTDVVREKTMSNVYDDNGATGALGSETLSITFNQTA